MRICVVGDCMVDRNIFIRAKKLCTEAPVPVFEEHSEEWTLGGAANVAAMCKALGAEVLLVGVCGVDEASEQMRRLLFWYDIEHDIEGDTQCQTTVKKRYFDVRDGQRHLVSRFDRDCQYKCTREDAEWFASNIYDWKPDAVIIQDHGKGIVCTELLSKLSARHEVFIDPAKTTPPINAIWISGIDELPTDVLLLSNHGGVIIKKGADGISSLDPDVFDMPAYCEKPVASCGAGDEFLAAFVVARMDGKSWREACEWASIASAIQVGRHGMTPVTREEIAAWTA